MNFIGIANGVNYVCSQYIIIQLSESMPLNRLTVDTPEV